MEGDNKGLNRREFLKKSLGAAGLLAILGTPAVPLLSQRKASASAPHSASGNKKAHAWCMVIDMKKCDGCTGLGVPPQCTQACIMGHYAPEGMKWIEVYEQKLPGGGRFFQPTPCYQCENAPCVNVCPVAATYHNEDGIVLIDHHRCIGCRFCMAACPYQRRFFNWGTPKLPPEAALAEYSPLYPVPAIKGTVIKCMFCAHFLRDGKLPYCVAACPRKVLYMGDFNEDLASNGAEVVKLSKFLDENNAYRYKEALGTQPRVWYLPGHGQEFGREAEDPRELKPTVWPWADGSYERRRGVWPWKESDIWTWEARPK
ncbi:MAG: 4Fe-4S dicluster domain-containing protein [Chloroflexi bacterium]|nr:4Fe-4S dicluster domain-containing protein [Chloroflexota bacterium]